MDDRDQAFPQDQAAALVVLEFPSFRDFIDAYSPIIAEDGIFIRDEDVAKSNAFTVGDHIDFEVRLKDDFRLIQGKGEVIRLGTDEAAGGASGAAVRFREIDEPSQRLISRLVDNYVRDGGKLFAVGAPVAAAAAEAAAVGESQLTAETLKASEAEALFSVEDDGELLSPVEVESLSPADAGAVPSGDIGESGDPLVVEKGLADPAAILEGPVGLETIAIPAGLIPDAPLPTKDTAISETLSAELEELEELDDMPSFDSDPDILDPTPPLESLDLPLLDDGTDGEEDSPPGAESVLAAALGEDDTIDPVVSLEESVSEIEDAEGPDLGGDDDEFEAAADSLESELGARVAIPDEIAQVAEELSGVHRFDPADDRERSGRTYAGAASAKSEGNVGGRIAALVVIATLLGATAYYFGDTIRGWFGLGDADVSPAEVAAVRPGEAPTAPPAGAVPAAGGDSTAVEGVEVGDTETSDADDPVDAGAEPDQGSVVAEVPGTDADEGVSPAATAAQVTRAAEATQPSPEPASEVIGSRRVEKIAWRREGATTVVTISLNTEVSQAYFEVTRVRGGAPREVLKIRGVDSPYSPKEVAVGSEQVLRLRTGLHQGQEGSVLHVVADLASPAVTILSVEPKGRDLEITFSS